MGTHTGTQLNQPQARPQGGTRKGRPLGGWGGRCWPAQPEPVQPKQEVQRPGPVPDGRHTRCRLATIINQHHPWPKNRPKTGIARCLPTAGRRPQPRCASCARLGMMPRQSDPDAPRRPPHGRVRLPNTARPCHGLRRLADAMPCHAWGALMMTDDCKSGAGTPTPTTPPAPSCSSASGGACCRAVKQRPRTSVPDLTTTVVTPCATAHLGCAKKDGS